MSLRRLQGNALNLIACATLACTNHGVTAQNERAAPQEFEVATIKPHPAGDMSSYVGGEPGRYEAKNATAKTLVEEAFHLPEQQVSGGPPWVDSQRFDVTAKLSESDWQKIDKLDYSRQQQVIRPMLQALLRERFQLEARHEPKELMVYALVTAKGGAKLRAAGEPKPPQPPDFGERPLLMTIDQKDISVGMLAEALTEQLGRTVVDQTGLAGRYDISFGVPVPPDSSGDEVEPAIFRALQDQLGLKLESRKAVVDTIVIERMEQPSPN